MLTLRQFANKLREEFPAEKPIKLRVTKVPLTIKEYNIRMYGDTKDNGDHYLIRINKDSDLSTQKDTLIHEWAHCLAGWDDDHSSHSKEWGIAYAKIYRKMVDPT
jgi:Zn-dependent peptidase ImmA (M78 family)